VKNAQPVSIAFLVWGFNASLAIVVFVSALAGAVAAVAVTMWTRLARRRKRKAAQSLVQ
jgi:uncharacterized integral membrane protein